MAEQKSALEAEGTQHTRQHIARFVMHEGERPRQLDRRRLSVARARIDEDAGAGRRGELVGKIAPQCDAAETFVQHDDGRRCVRPRPDHAVFQPHVVKFEETLVGERSHLLAIMAGLVPAISLRKARPGHMIEITGTSPVMTAESTGSHYPSNAARPASVSRNSPPP